LSRNTVVIAYELLAAEGVVKARQGSAVRVIGGAQIPRFDVAALLRQARFPEHLVGFEDDEGTPMFLRFSR